MLLINTIVLIDTFTSVELILDKSSLAVLFISEESLCIADHLLTCFSKEQVIEAYSLVHTIIYCISIEQKTNKAHKHNRKICHFFPFSERKGYMAFKYAGEKSLKFVCPSVQVQSETIFFIFYFTAFQTFDQN